MSKLTLKKREKFLDRIASGGTVTQAATAIGVSRQAVYQLRDSCEDFRASWDSAVEQGTEVMEAEAFRRAVTGTLKPVWQGGKRVGSVREFSDTLLIFMLKARDPAKYRERHEITVIQEEAARLASERGIESARVVDLSKRLAERAG